MQPLDYRNPKPQPKPVTEKTRTQTVIPIEFDTLLTRTSDHPAAREIQAELLRNKIEFHVAHDGARVKRIIELYIRVADQERACGIAASIFARRKKLQAFAPRNSPADNGPFSRGVDLPSFLQ